MLNTPPWWSVYMSGLYFEYMLERGLKHFEALAKLKAGMFYDAIDSSKGYY